MAGMSFRTLSNPNFQAAIYSLSIRSPGYSALDYLTYTFPLSPESLRKDWTAMTAVYDTAGTPAQLGVNRDVDLFGQTPPTFSIEGTTGWKNHQTDGYLYSGLDSIRELELFLQKYTKLNQTLLSQQQTKLYTLEFYDYFRGEYWQVVPEGPQGIMQTRDRPLYVNYRFRLAAIKPVNAPILGVIDALANIFGSPAIATAANVAYNIGSFLDVYIGSGIL